VIPRAADVFSAWGMLISDLRRDYFRTHLTSLSADAADELDGLVREAERLASAQFDEEGIDRERVRFVRFGQFRYENQEHSVEVRLPSDRVTAGAIDVIARDFHDTYEREYTYRLDAPVEFVGLHLVAEAEIGNLEPEPLPVTGVELDAVRKGEREVDFDLEGVHTAAVYDGTRLEPGMAFGGPAIVETPGGTVVVHPANRAHIDDYGNLHIELP
jgi:N-methylhydantoinase A